MSSLPVTRKPRYRLDAVSISYHLPTSPSKPLLSDVTVSARPSELLAIVGPSGAGKTTLLSILAGTTPLSSGHLLLNSLPLLSFSKFRRLSAYVTQDDDSLFPLLTVRETISFSARLRCGHHSSSRVDAILKDLSLDHVANSRVASLSGGERRRVSIGSEIVHDPQLLLLDEPTSGLDSASALHVISLLHSMAVHHNKTVILTVHQPGSRILDLFHRLLLLSNGSVKHHGPLSSLHRRLLDSNLPIPPHVNVLDVAMDLIDSLTPHITTTTITTPHFKNEHINIHYANSRFTETLILAARFFKNVLRTKQLSSARMIQCALAGLALGTIFKNVDTVQSRVGLFAFTLTFLLSSTTEGLPVFLQERRILTKETSRGAYRVSSYVIANSMVFIPFLLLVSLFYSAPVYWLVGLRKEVDGFIYFSVVIWMVMMMANSFVACFSALVPNFIMGNSLIAGFMGSFFLFSGYFIAKKNIPKYWIWMHYMSLFKYPFEGFMVNEYENGDDGRMVLRQQGLHQSQKWSSLGVMMGFIVGYRLLCFLILWVRCYKLRR